MRKTRKLRELLEANGILIAPGAHDALTARIIEKIGFEAVYMTGFGVSATFGQPDVGLLTMVEMATRARDIASSVEIPVIVDADDGYGNAINVMRTVREFERAGVAALHLEDQKSPKRCGLLPGKRCVSREEMLGKIGAALDAREDKNLVLIARTDACDPLGVEEAIERGNIYAKAGADVIMVITKSYENLKLCAERIDAPIMTSPQPWISWITTEQLEEDSLKLVIFSIPNLQVAAKAILDLMGELKSKGTVKNSMNKMLSFQKMLELVGLPEFLEYERKYIPK